MGAGIEQRHQRCASWWEPHLRCSREFIRTSLRPCRRVAVLGAGRLLDVDIEMLLAHSQEVHLFDADSGCLFHWRARLGPRLGGRAFAHIEDITGSLKRWEGILRASRRRGDLAECLRGLRAVRPAWSKAEFCSIVSLNLLGQIPLYWRDFVQASRGRLSGDDEEALAASMGELQRAHLEALFSSGAGQLVMLFDSEYYRYRSSESEWRVEPALFGPAAMNCLSAPPQFCELARESWLWHLAPQFVEQESEGEIHRVEARAWLRKAGSR